MKDKLGREFPPGYVSPLDLISMIFWVTQDGDENETETMTTAEVMVYLKSNRYQMTKWKAENILVPISRGRYDTATVRAFVPPARR